ncbi:MAG: cytidine deaminase [Erysipelotrichaceae bacterium]|nr:cytidine deaminase [Erysipelotrichaceae bacterium]MBO4538319.1 cytidine deaminase [Erysipelotrichaceae bacterium]MBR5049265.1 cytidine deaminase [Erysipelotrichaceae bacterium]
MEQKELISLAFSAAKNAYAPYSNYKVGACCLVRDGNYFLGANVENASYGATNCAERNAVFAAYTYGYRRDDIVALAIVSYGKTVAAPCGICRQVLSELLTEYTPIILSNGQQTVIKTIGELLPMSFGKEDME